MNIDSAREELDRIQAYADRIDRLSEAEEDLYSLMDSLGPRDISQMEGEIRQAIDDIPSIMGKRKNRILERLEVLAGSGSRNANDEKRLLDPSEIRTLRGKLRTELKDLSRHHIFQWSTYYRDVVVRFFEWVRDIAYDVENPEILIRAVQDEFEKHSEEIFAKGYTYVTEASGLSHSVAINKSTNGLQRFLELPIEYYSNHAPRARAGWRAQLLRRVCSGLLGGITHGYASTELGDSHGGAILPRYPRSWLHFVAFMTHTDLQQLVGRLEPGPMRSGLEEAVLPTVQALDSLAQQPEEGRFALPGLGDFVWDSRRIDISLFPPPWMDDKGFIDIQCFLDASFVNRSALEQAANRGIDLTVAPLRPDLSDWAESHDVLRGRVVNTASSRSSDDPIDDRIVQLLSFAISREKSEVDEAAPITYNFARDFPLQSPSLARYFHVYRPSIRTLLQGFERKNGARLWCSVRRSGKTTACFDLGSTTGTSVVVSQTCDHTDQYPGADKFITDFLGVMKQGRELPADFFSSTVKKLAAESGGETARYVFVLDEYETLFERMRLGARDDRELRYTIFQPLLNQMVGFSKDNLIIFIGQRPDAHFIFMDQNQLSAYVEQDAFPLFQFSKEDTSSEFHELLRKVLTERAVFDSQFAEDVYRETTGHPYLTVKLLITFFDWLMEKEWRVSDLSFSSEHFDDFASEQLNPETIGGEEEYVFFTQAIGEALSEGGRRHTPWLHSVYRILKGMGSAPENGFSISTNEFRELVQSARLEEELGLTAEYLMNSGARANFFDLGANDRVSAKIPLLARIADVATERVNW